MVAASFPEDTLQVDVQARHAHDSIRGRDRCLWANSSSIEYVHPKTLLSATRFDMAIKVMFLSLALRGLASRAVEEAYLAVIDLEQHESDRSLRRPPEEIIEAAVALGRSVRESGFDAADAAPVLRCRRGTEVRYSLVEGAHRVAAAVALDLAAMPVRVCEVGVCRAARHSGMAILNGSVRKCLYDRRPCSAGARLDLAGRTWNYRHFKQLGLPDAIGDLGAYEITTRKSLHLLHIWPYGEVVIEKTMPLMQLVQEISTHTHIWYMKRVAMSRQFVKHYLHHIYGQTDYLALKTHFQMQHVRAATLTVLWIELGASEAQALRDRYRVLCHEVGHPWYYDTFHVTDSHHDAVLSSQILLFPNSMKLLSFAPRAQRCADLSVKAGQAVGSATREAPISGSTPHSPWPLVSGASLGPVSFSFLLGLSPRKRVDLVLDGSSDWVFEGARADVQRWSWALVSDLAILHDPSNYGYCYGIKFLALDAHAAVVYKNLSAQSDIRAGQLVQSRRIFAQGAR